MAGWYYRQLDRSGREVYDGMRAGFAALAPAIRLPRLEGERLSEIYLRLKLDEPLLFHVTGFKYRFDPRGDHIELIPEYLFDKGKIRQHRQAVAARLGATHCGFVFHAGSPRCVDAVTVSRLESGSMVRVGVFTGQDSGEIARIMRLARLDLADQSEECARQLGPERVIRVLWPQRYGDAASLEAAAGRYADSCSLYLLDAGRAGGGSGRTLAWEDLGSLHLSHPWLLAGGMSPANFRQALTQCRPDGVDCNSGVEEAPGRKDARAMVEMARLAVKVFRDGPAGPSVRA